MFLDALRKVGREATGPEINDEIAAGTWGTGLKAPTMSKAGAALVAAGLVVGTPGPDRFSPKTWRLTEWPASATGSPGVKPAVTVRDDPALAGLVSVSTVSKSWKPHIVKAGDVITSPAGAWHWHGALPSEPMSHVTVEDPGLDLDVPRGDYDEVYTPDLGS